MAVELANSLTVATFVVICDRQLVAVFVNRTKEIVADRVGNVEVVPGHQTPVVMTYMMPSQAIHERHSADPGLWIHMVGKMQQLVIEKIQDRG